MRERQRAEGRTHRAMTARWRDRDPREAPAGVAPAIRLKAPRDRRDGDRRPCARHRHRGQQAARRPHHPALATARQPTISPSSSTTTTWAITHVIRGDDHLNNAFRQAQIYHALDWPVPEFAHVPLIHGPDGAQAVEASRRARRRCLSRHGLLARSAPKLSAAARLEPWRRRDHLDRAGDRVVRSRRDRPLAGALRLRQARQPQWSLHPRGGRRPARRRCSRRGSSGPSAGRSTRRCARASLAAHARPQATRQDARRAGRGRPVLRRSRGRSRSTPRQRRCWMRRAAPACRRWRRALTATPWSAPALETAVRDFAEGGASSSATAAQPLRAALSGSTASPPIFEVMVVLGRDETLGASAPAGCGRPTSSPGEPAPRLTRSSAQCNHSIAATSGLCCCPRHAASQ